MNKEEIKLLNEMLKNCKSGFEYYTDPKAEAKEKAIKSALNLQQRIEKAIECVKDWENNINFYGNDLSMCLDELLSILKGENNEL